MTTGPLLLERDLNEMQQNGVSFLMRPSDSVRSIQLTCPR
jgi:hypothetical protein